jgi:deoxyribonuclease-4
MSCSRCGRHISVKPTLFETVKECKDNEKCCQIFCGNPQSYITRNVPRSDVVATREYLSEKDMKLYVHAPYLINLAREGDDSIVSKGKACLQNLINTLYQIGPEHTGIIVHTGAKGSIESLNKVLNDMEILVPVYMENCAEKSKLGKNMDEMRKIIEGTDSNKIGICIDTCHAFASGMTDFREISATEKLFNDIDYFGNRKTMFHVNDSLTPLGGSADRHSPIGYGHIWNINVPGSKDSLSRFYELTKTGCYDIIFETPNPVSNELEAEMFNVD